MPSSPKLGSSRPSLSYRTSAYSVGGVNPVATIFPSGWRAMPKMRLSPSSGVLALPSVPKSGSSRPSGRYRTTTKCSASAGVLDCERGQDIETAGEEVGRDDAARPERRVEGSVRVEAREPEVVLVNGS